MSIVLIYGNLLFPCVDFPESAVCHVTGIKNENRFCKKSKKCKDIRLIIQNIAGSKLSGNMNE